MAEGSNARLPERLERIQRSQATERRRRDQERECRHEHGTVECVGRKSNGALVLYRGCRDCRKPMGGQELPKPDDLSEFPAGYDRRWENPPCVRCGAFGTELHHFAPRALFGRDEAELWPTAWLCVTPDGGCHAYWHRVMAGATYQPQLGEVM